MWVSAKVLFKTSNLYRLSKPPKAEGKGLANYWSFYSHCFYCLWPAIFSHIKIKHSLHKSFHFLSSYSVHFFNARVNQYFQLFIPFFGKIWNSLPTFDIFLSNNLNSFKREAPRHLFSDDWFFCLVSFTELLQQNTYMKNNSNIIHNLCKCFKVRSICCPGLQGF